MLFRSLYDLTALQRDANRLLGFTAQQTLDLSLIHIYRCVHVIYRKYFENPLPENMPLLEDLYNALLTQDEPEARHEMCIRDSI